MKKGNKENLKIAPPTYTFLNPSLPPLLLLSPTRCFSRPWPIHCPRSSSSCCSTYKFATRPRSAPLPPPPPPLPPLFLTPSSSSSSADATTTSSSHFGCFSLLACFVHHCLSALAAFFIRSFLHTFSPDFLRC